MPLNTDINCYCGSMAPASQCCARFIYQGQIASTAVELMRSRYSAHVYGAIDYLWQTWSTSSRHSTSPEAIHQWANRCEWLGLEILDWHKGGVSDQEGTVTFIAQYRLGQKTHQHLEKSLFRREQSFWRYVDHCA
ncbi:YchJ family protein [Gilvimarinus sp. 1_MG-2023]|uniref:YchJ family protein n=1 Tax=Gilvimarinus sp. 1_MG-2023 TaxID=3062638 RepID=UPI0026E183DB|nr:YchJ family metal-binding protein [Gilvimarinus sp. 1_MG-2023]MDO6747435.1 YchJ family metal-binding protein [Gilvimarinus sp. 1_MG-2023]